MISYLSLIHVRSQRLRKDWSFSTSFSAGVSLWEQVQHSINTMIHTILASYAVRNVSSTHWCDNALAEFDCTLHGLIHHIYIYMCQTYMDLEDRQFHLCEVQNTPLTAATDDGCPRNLHFHWRRWEPDHVCVQVHEEINFQDALSIRYPYFIPCPSYLTKT